MDYRIVPVGDAAATVEFENEISPEANGKVAALQRGLADARIPGIVEMNPTYRALLICFDPVLLRFRDIEKAVRKQMSGLSADGQKSVLVYRIPVCYGGDYGEDLADVAAHTGFTPDEVIARHAAVDYRIYMLGFLPGFSYLGGMDPALKTPRLPQPRKVIPAGSVGIGGSQTGIYPLDSPGGWRLIGRTPVRPYDAKQGTVLYAAGDYIRFYPITPAEYDEISRQVEAGTYRCPSERRG